MASASTSIPMPPSQCKSDRQNKIPSGKISTSLITVEPVVVNPDTVSKKASEKLGRTPEK